MSYRDTPEDRARKELENRFFDELARIRVALEILVKKQGGWDEYQAQLREQGLWP